MSGQRPARRSRDSGHSGASIFDQDDRFGRSVSWEDRKYLILTNRGDEYLRKIEVAQWEACKLHFSAGRKIGAKQRSLPARKSEALLFMSSRRFRDRNWSAFRDAESTTSRKPRRLKNFPLFLVLWNDRKPFPLPTAAAEEFFSFSVPKCRLKEPFRHP